MKNNPLAELTFLAENRADEETYAEQWQQLFEVVCAVGSELYINPYDFLDMLEDLRQLMRMAMADNSTMQ